MVYLDGANDLDPYAQANLAAMEAVGSTANVTVLVQYKGDSGSATSAVRYRVDKGSLVKVADLGNINMASGDTVRDFVSFGITNYPADHFALVLWDHGEGWKPGVAYASNIRSILTDWVSNGNKSPELANYYVAQGIQAAETATGKTLDIIGTDACIMATIEAVYEFRNLAGFFVSSQDLVQANGWDYQNLLTRLTQNPAMTPQQLAANMVESYKNYVVSQGYSNQTISALRLGAGIEAVASAVDALGSSLKAKLDTPSTRDATLSLLTTARAQVQPFDLYVDVGTYVDLYQLSQLLEGPGTTIQSAIQNITVDEYHGSARPGAHGISIVFFDLPTLYNTSTILNYSIYDPDYINLNNTRQVPITFLDAFLSWPHLLDTYYTLQYPDMYAKLQQWPAQ